LQGEEAAREAMISTWLKLPPRMRPTRLHSSTAPTAAPLPITAVV
jgi:hypothetical protein